MSCTNSDLPLEKENSRLSSNSCNNGDSKCSKGTSISRKIEVLKSDILNYDGATNIVDALVNFNSEFLLASHELDNDSLCSSCRDFVRDNPLSDTISDKETNQNDECESSKNEEENSNSWISLFSSGSENSTKILSLFNMSNEKSLKHLEIIKGSQYLQNAVNEFKYRTIKSINNILKRSDLNEELVSEKLKCKKEEMYGIKLEFEKEITLIDNEIKNLAKSKIRLSSALKSILQTESIIKECLDRRSKLKEYELVRDKAEDELLLEFAFIEEIQTLYQRLLKEIDIQIGDNKAVKMRLEEDWSNKKQTSEIDAYSLSLDSLIKSTVYTPGALNYPEKQATQGLWENFTKQLLIEAQKTRCKSVKMRNVLDEIIYNSAKDVHKQRKNILLSFSTKIRCSYNLIKRLEGELQKILKKLTEADELKTEIEAAIRCLNDPLKKATTRLGCRSKRPGLENCFDGVQSCLLMECRTVDADLASLGCYLDEVRKVQNTLHEAKFKLEKELRSRRISMEIDNENLNLIEEYFPSISDLSGSKAFEQ